MTAISFMNSDAVREAVRERYASAAQSSSCCGPSASACCGDSGTDPMSGVRYYTAKELAGLSAEVAGFSLGCGNPVAFADPQPGETVLDLGSGGGLDCFIAARCVGPTGHVIGVDMTPAMLERARQAAVDMGYTTVEFRQGYIEALPVADNAVDLVISNCVINLSTDKDRVFGEAFRVLKPGGRLVVSDIVTAGALPDAIRRNVSLWAECIAGALPESEYTAKMAAAGFERIEPLARAAYGDNDLLQQAPGDDEFSAVYSLKVRGYKPS